LENARCRAGLLLSHHRAIVLDAFSARGADHPQKHGLLRNRVPAMKPAESAKQAQKSQNESSVCPYILDKSKADINIIRYLAISRRPQKGNMS
jgi:hypothetical protein